MSFVSTISSFAETVWFNCRRSVLRCRVRRYRRFAIFDEVRVGNDLVMTHQRRDLKFEDKVADFNRKYKRLAPKGAVPVTVSLRKSNVADKEPRRPFSLFVFFTFDFKDTLTVQKGNCRVVVDRTAGLDVYGSLKASLQVGGEEDLYRQAVLSVETAKEETKSTGRGAVKSVTPEKPTAPEAPETPTPEPEPQSQPGPAEGTIVLDPDAVAREHERFVGNVGKIGKAIGSGSADGPVEFEDHERMLVEHLLGCEDYKASKQDLQALLTPLRKRLGSVLDSLNRKSCDITGEPLVVQIDGTGDFQMIVSYYNIIFSDGR